METANSLSKGVVTAERGVIYAYDGERIGDMEGIEYTQAMHSILKIPVYTFLCGHFELLYEKVLSHGYVKVYLFKKNEDEAPFALAEILIRGDHFDITETTISGRDESFFCNKSILFIP